MRIALIFDTKRKKATVQVVEWLKEAINKAGEEVVAGRPSDFSDLDFDGFLIGTSIYARNAQPAVLEFLVKNGAIICQKPFATFVVCKRLIVLKKTHNSFGIIFPVTILYGGPLKAT